MFRKMFTDTVIGVNYHWHWGILPKLLLCAREVCCYMNGGGHDAIWRSGGVIGHINKVAVCQAWLVLGWVITAGSTPSVGEFISVLNQRPRSTEPGRPSMISHSDYHPVDDDALLVSIDRYGMCLMSGKF